MAKDNFEKNLVSGSVVKQLIIFSIPMLISNIVQSIYSVADMMIVGQFSGPSGISAVNIGSQATFLLTNMVFGLSVGATVLIGQYLGSGEKERMKKTVSTLFTTLVILGVVLTVIMLFLEVPLLKLIQTPTESFKETQDYYFVTILGLIFIFIYNALSAVMRGMGNSTVPLVFVSIACGVNIALDFLFVGAFKMGALGAAIATVISQAVSAILCIIYLKKIDFCFDFKFKSFEIDKESLRMILKVGVPSSIQNVLTTVSFLFLTALVNTIGMEASAAVGVVGKFNGFAILPALAMSSSISAMSAQNLGAGEYKRAKKTMYVGLAIAMVISTLIFVLVTLFPEPIIKMFDDDPLMVQYGVEYIKTFSFDYLIVPIMFCLTGLFIGAGHTTYSFITGVTSSILVRIPASYFFGMVLDWGLMGVGLGAPLASVVATIIALVLYFSGAWKKMKIVKH